jgi:hypothetical protein
MKIDFLEFLVAKKRTGKKVVAYGAAAKGNTLLNYFGIGKELIEFIVDASPMKQGKYLPGSHLKVMNENDLIDYKPDYIIIFPWNLTTEIVHQLSYVRDWGGQFVVSVPSLKVF